MLFLVVLVSLFINGLSDFVFFVCFVRRYRALLVIPDEMEVTAGVVWLAH